MSILGPPRSSTSVHRWRFLALLISSIALIFGIGVILLTPMTRAGFHTGLFVLQTLDSPVKPQTWFTRQPLRLEVAYPRPNGEGLADIYRPPGDDRRAGVLLFLGANAAGRDDPDVISLGTALARAGFVVMLHWSPSMGLHSNIDPAEIENLVWAFQYLRSLDYVDPDRAGMGGFSVGGSFAIVSAADPRIRDDVRFVNSFGAYYDARDLFLQIASGTRIYQDQQMPWEVDRLTRLIFANELMETIPYPSERELLEQLLNSSVAIQHGDLGRLSDHTQTVQRLLEGTTPDEAVVLLQRMPPDFQTQMDGISPSAHLSDLKATLMVMHDQGDLLIPVEESRRLAEAMKGTENFRYTETELFDHVRPGARTNWWQLVNEAAKLYSHMYSIIRIAV